MTHLLRRLREPASPRKLAAFRIALGLHVALLYTSESWWLLMEIGGQPNRLTNTVLPAAAEAFLDARLVGPAVIATGIAAVAFALGFISRLSGWLTFAGFVISHHFYYRHTHYHDEWPYLWFFLLVMAMAPCADVWSIDAWRRRRASDPAATRPADGGRAEGELEGDAPRDWTLAYRWPVEAMIGWFALIYAAAGTAKLMPLRKGIEWLDGPTVHRLVGMRYFDSPVQWLLGRPAFDYTASWPFTAMAIATVAVECGAILMIFSRRAYPWLYAAIIGMHLVIYLLGVPGFLGTALLSGLLFVPSRWYDTTAARVGRLAQRAPLGRTVRIQSNPQSSSQPSAFSPQLEQGPVLARSRDRQDHVSGDPVDLCKCPDLFC